MSKTGEIPYSWARIEEQIREAIMCHASILYAFAPYEDGQIVRTYLGLGPVASADPDDLPPDEIAKLDITRHALHHHVRVAYDYAYQCGSIDKDNVETSWHDVDGLLQGFPQTDANGEPSPFCTLNDFPLRRMLETFFARFALFDNDPDFNDYKPSIRELSLLANMTVPAVRTSLSKEGFRLDKEKVISRGNQEEAGFRMNGDDAKLWLSRRRGFIPQRSDTDGNQVQQAIEQVLADRDCPFPLAINRIMGLRKVEESLVLEWAGIERSWLSALIAGQVVEPDLTALRSLARALNVSEPDFVSVGIKHILTIETAIPDATQP